MPAPSPPTPTAVPTPCSTSLCDVMRRDALRCNSEKTSFTTTTLYVLYVRARVHNVSLYSLRSTENIKILLTGFYIEFTKLKSVLLYVISDTETLFGEFAYSLLYIRTERYCHRVKAEQWQLLVCKTKVNFRSRYIFK